MAKKTPPEIQAIMSALDAQHWLTAVILLQKFLQENPDSLRGWLDLGSALGQLTRYAQAEEAYKKALELADQQADGIFGAIGHLHRSRGDFSQAADWYRKQIEAAPNDATGWLFLGNIQLNQGDHDSALESFQNGLKCSEGCLEEVHYCLGLAWCSAGELFKAKSELEAAVKLDPKFELAKVALKDVNKAKGLAD